MSEAPAEDSPSESISAKSPKTAKWLDRVELTLLLSLFALLNYRVVIEYIHDPTHWAKLLLLPSEGLVVFFLLIRRDTNRISLSVTEWLLAFGATTAPMLVQVNQNQLFFFDVPSDWRMGEPLASDLTAGALLLAGILIQLSAKIALGRSIGCVPADRGIKTVGPYYFVRHPMYCGYALSNIAFLLVVPTPWNFAIYSLVWSLQIPRLLAEEKLLRQNPEYQDYCQKVPYRVVPFVF